MKRALVVVLVLLLAAAAAAKLFLFEIPSVAGNDMAPALQAGDRLLAYRLGGGPARGELVLIEHPAEPRRLLLRRVVALPGERFAFRGETPIVDGKPARRAVQREVTLLDDGKKLRMRLVEEELAGVRYLVLKDPARRSHDEKERALVGGYYVLADNRNHGTDSRNFGPVPAARIRARITHRLSAGAGSIEGQAPREGWRRLP
jgi:signal peptidase I